jgi:lysozyme family protein
MPQSENEIRALVTETKVQLDNLMLFGTEEQRELAKKLKDALTLQELQSALDDFHARTASLVELTTHLQNVIDRIQLNPVTGLVDRFKGLLSRASDIMRIVHDAEVLRSAHDTAEEVETVVGSIPSIPIVPAPSVTTAAAPPTAPRNSKRFEDLAAEYQAYFDTSQIRPDKLSQVRWYTDRLLRFQERYREVGDPLSIPWYFIGAVHALEGGFNFETHLHNGDPLTRKTTHVPKDRPNSGSPPFRWVDSAKDALMMKGFHTQANWSLPAMLYRWEAYNGFGYRPQGLPTPYLWSFSNHYTSGKFVQDGVFKPDAVSKQCGAAVMLRDLIDRGEVRLP